MSKQYLANSMKRGRPTLEAPISQKKIQTPNRVAGQETSISLFFRPLPSLPEKTPQTVGREAAFGGAAARSKLYSDPNQNCSDDDIPICGSLFRAIGEADDTAHDLDRLKSLTAEHIDATSR